MDRVCLLNNNERILWRARSDGSDWLQLTPPKLFVYIAQVSPDSKRIALMAGLREDPWKVYWVPIEGGVLHELAAPITNQADPNWMPDNQSILFGQPPRYWAEPDVPRAIYIHNIETNVTSKVPGSDGWFSPRLSPDGSRSLALSIDEHKLAMYDLATSQWRVLLENRQKKVGSPLWSSDGRRAYVNMFEKENVLQRLRLPDGAAEEVMSIDAVTGNPTCWACTTAPDGSIMISCFHINNNIYALKYE